MNENLNFIFVSPQDAAFFMKQDNLAILDWYNIHLSLFIGFLRQKVKSKKSPLS